MTTPVILVTGFLGAGKSTAINAMLQTTQEPIAAIVNDFGSINIDEELVTSQAGDVIGLNNGCVCCTLQGDLLRTLKLVLKSDPSAIVIEASGVSDPQGILEALADKVLWNTVRLEAVLCLVDAEDIAANPSRMDDPLWKAQVADADFVLLSKTEALQTDALTIGLAARSRAKVLYSHEGTPPLSLLLARTDTPRPQSPARAKVSADRFVSIEWTSLEPIPMRDFQAAIQKLAPMLLRAKGFITPKEKPEQPMLFQLVGRRATLEPAKTEPAGCKLVLIGEKGQFDPDVARAALTALAPTS